MRSSRALAALAAALLALPAAARAAGPDDKSDPKFAARALAEHGYALYEAGRYKEAIESLTEADKLFHAPTIVLALGRAYAGAGKLVEARDVLRRVVDEKLAPGSPAAFVEAQKTARDELAAVERRIPTLQIAVRGGRGGSLTVRLDDAPLSDWTPDRVIPVNPGAHHVTVVPAGDVGVSRAVTLDEGARQRVEIELPGAAPVVLPVAVAPPAAPPPPPPPPSQGRGWLAPAIVGFGAGAVGLAVGIGTGVGALNGASTIKKLCGGDVCAAGKPTTAQAKSDLSSANGLATASTIGFVIAAAGVATGVVLVVVRPGSGRQEKAAITIGPGSIGIAGEL
jgi:hypothetical protein